MKTFKEYILNEDQLTPKEALEQAVKYTDRYNKRPPKELEDIILQDRECTWGYMTWTLRLIGCYKWPEGEKAILTSPHYCSAYARDILKKRWPEAEPTILTSARHTYEYMDFWPQEKIPQALDVLIKDKEDWFGRHKEWWKRYLEFPENKERKKEIYWTVLKYDPKNIQFLEDADKDMQEFAIQRNPGVINSIKNLDPELAEKYSKVKKTSDLGII